MAIGAGLDLALRPGTAYGAICACGNTGCGCGSTCCSGFSEFCCSVSRRTTTAPTNTVMGGWWMADNSSYCGGPRYYMDCNATCTCDDRLQRRLRLLRAGCDQTDCGCGPQGCDSYLTGCLQFRYGQCNQDVPCMGRIVCRVVACVPPWRSTPRARRPWPSTTVRPSRTSPAGRRRRPSPPCLSPATNCQVVGLAASPDGGGYAVLTSFGKLFPYGDFANDG